MAAKPKKPTLKKYRKKPKSSASVESWEKYDSHVKDVDKANREKMDAYNKALKDFKKDAKTKADLIKKHSR